MLIIVKGRFNMDQLRQLAMTGAKDIEKHRSVELFEMPQGTPTTPAKAVAVNKTRIAFLDGNTILAGDRAEVKAAIDRLKLGRLTAPKGGVLDGIGALASKNDLWMVIDIPASALKDAPPAAAQMFAGVRGAELGMSFQQGFGLQMNIRAKDEASAATVAQALQGLIAMGAMSQSQSPQSAEMLKKLQITTEKSRVRLALALDKSQLEQIIKEAQTSRVAASTPKTPATRAPEPTGPRAIRITGLDSGPVEVPLAQTK